MINIIIVIIILGLIFFIGKSLTILSLTKFSIMLPLLIMIGISAYMIMNIKDSYNLKKNIESIQDINKKTKYLLLYEKYNYKKFKTIGRVEKSFIKQVLTQKATEEGYIIEEPSHLKLVDVYKNVNVPEGLIEEKVAIEEKYEDANIYIYNNQYYIKFLYGGYIYIYKKIQL